MEMLFVVLVAVASMVTGCRGNLTAEWERWVDKFGCHGDTEERFSVWSKNWEYIEHHNSQFNISYTLAMNHLGTLVRVCVCIYILAMNHLGILVRVCVCVYTGQ